MGAGGPEGDAPMAGGPATPDESRPGPGRGRRAFINGGSTAVGGCVRHVEALGPAGDEASEVTMRSEEDEAA